jgi:hypothetical protein
MDSPPGRSRNFSGCEAALKEVKQNQSRSASPAHPTSSPPCTCCPPAPRSRTRKLNPQRKLNPAGKKLETICEDSPNSVTTFRLERAAGFTEQTREIRINRTCLPNLSDSTAQKIAWGQSASDPSTAARVRKAVSTLRAIDGRRAHVSSGVSMGAEKGGLGAGAGSTGTRGADTDLNT